VLLPARFPGTPEQETFDEGENSPCELQTQIGSGITKPERCIRMRTIMRMGRKKCDKNSNFKPRSLARPNAAYS
jgi:hypothetical protein